MSGNLATVLGGLVTLSEDELRKVADVTAALLPKAASPAQKSSGGQAPSEAPVVTPNSSVDDLSSAIVSMRVDDREVLENPEFRELLSAVKAAAALPASGPRGHEVRNALKSIRVSWNKVPGRVRDLFE
jgi:hypothetical protein